MNLLHVLLSRMKAGHTSRTIISVFQKTVNIWPIKFCTCFALYQEDILVSAICMHCPLRKKQKSKLFVADMPAPYRRGRLKKRNLISSIKKRFTGGRAAAKQNAMFFFNFPATPQQQNTLYFYLFKRKPCCRHPITLIGTRPKREVARLPFQHKWRLAPYK